MENTKTWLLIANASKAQLYSLHKARFFQEQHPQNLNSIAQYTHDKSRQKGTELATDKLGGFGTGTFVEATTPKFHEAEVFAIELIQHLNEGRAAGSFRDIVLIAPPTFMGLLHKHMPQETHKLISQTIEKDYTAFSGHELVKNLMTHF
ncbi:MAG: host attachment protein [Gammaproteobacteria bacterium]|nr:MAG: host attachment protein [Gammaproteobacteria bacterium]